MKYFSTQQKKIRISKRPCNVLEILLLLQRRDLLCSHGNGDLFTYEGIMLFQCVKIPYFSAKAHLV